MSRLENAFKGGFTRQVNSPLFPSLDSDKLNDYGEGSNVLRNPEFGFEQIDLVW